MTTTATTVNKNIMEIRNVFCTTEHQERVKLGSQEPYRYVVTVAFRCEPPLGPWEEPPADGYAVQVRITPAEMAYLNDKLGVGFYSACIGMSFNVNPEWDTHDAASAFKKFLDR